MCGIIGILGQTVVVDRLLEGLSRLEYRGYDSAGVAVLTNNGPAMRRSVGKLTSLRDEVARYPLEGKVGIGHTRWATHGAPTQVNAHPHRSGQVSVVHNGIIENYAEIRAELEADGWVFQSETDTEVVASQCDQFLHQGDEPQDAVRKTLRKLEGAYALSFLFDGAPDQMIVARLGSPLVIGYGPAAADGSFELFVGSDAVALAPFTSQISYLEDGDMAVLSPGRVLIEDENGMEVVREITEIHTEDMSVDKGPYQHFMAKEIHEQPDSLRRALLGLVDHHSCKLKPFLEEIDFAGVDRVLLVACGTAHYACHIAKYWLEDFAGLPVEVEIASEFRYRNVALSGREIAIFVSQSGETADTLAALNHLRNRVAHRVAVVNVPTSSIAREAEHIVEIQAGPEIGVASTKAFTGQLICLAALAVKAGLQRGTVSQADEQNLLSNLTMLPRQITEILALDGAIQAVAKDLVDAGDVLFLGRGVMYPLALEAALKLKEISYIHAEGYAAGELKHGPIALIDQSVPVVVFAPSDEHFEKLVSNGKEVAARGGRLIWVTDPKGASKLKDVEGSVLKVPEAWDAWAPIAHAVVAQLIAYHVAVLKGTDVDQPRNLAKSVTVE
ncbi:glutamine--fructose-6-phosphate transaminase [Shimia gijangensis]|uniref:Glutamine--fructose-6-phosphate aminotransferase [isomerizing] n=1 Tax=Shimia gijangensis TaxID=1470563 RepID=A0A1M6SEQ5_9RHOB|nr:glutamine--fructose-6-phosphate transaminase (isomerizing) [Shimia gijangensis]SHK43264.1 glutamine--fructose-6-phosphate transaminase [Shimia gijangensis]